MTGGVVRIVSHPVEPMPALAPREAAWQDALAAAIVDAPGKEAVLARLRLPGALAVTTGQQPGLFTGPLYAIHKALAAASLARVLETKWRRPVIPLFWVAGDDHDFAEASGASWLDAAGKLVDWKLPPRAATAPQYSMAREAVPPGIGDGLALLEQSLPAGPHRDATMHWLQRAYGAGHTMHSASAAALAELLTPRGILLVDAPHMAVKRAQAPLISKALARAGELDRALAALPAADTGIEAGDGATLVFLETDAGRDRLLVDGDAFITRRSRERYTLAALDALLTSAPERFSANVLLRPIVESALFPTVAYVGGPAEVKYLTRQAATLYPLLGVERQTPVSRWSGTAVEPWAERLLQRLHLTVEAVTGDDGTIARELLRRDLPSDAVAALAILRDTIDRVTGTITVAGRAIDGVLDRAIDGRKRRLQHVTDDLERLLERHLRRRDDIAHAQFARLRDALLPHGVRQERVLTSATLLGRYGDAWLDAVSDATDAWATGQT